MSDTLGMIAIVGSQALTTATNWGDTITNLVSIICTCSTALTMTAVIIYNMWKYKKTKNELYDESNKSNEQKYKCEVEIVDEQENRD